MKKYYMTSRNVSFRATGNVINEINELRHKFNINSRSRLIRVLLDEAIDDLEKSDIENLSIKNLESEKKSDQESRTITFTAYENTIDTVDELGLNRSRTLRKLLLHSINSLNDDQLEDLLQTESESNQESENTNQEKEDDGWSEDEIKVIKENYKTLTDRQIAQKLNRKLRGVRRKRRQLGIKKKKEVNWSKEEEDFLEQNYLDMSDSNLSEKLDKTKSAIRKKRYNMNLLKDKGKNRQEKEWTQKEKRFIKENYKDKTDAEIADKLDKTKSAIRKKRYNMNFLKKKGKNQKTIYGRRMRRNFLWRIMIR